MNPIKPLISLIYSYFKSRPGMLKSIGAAIGTFIAGWFASKGRERKKAEKEKRQYIDAIKKHQAEIRRLEHIRMSDRRKMKLIKKQQKQIDALMAKIEELESRGI